MRDIELTDLSKYSDAHRYEKVAEGVYRDLAEPEPDGYRVTLSFVSEEGEGQYPLEDLLDEYLIHVAEFVTEAPTPARAGERCTLEFGGMLDGVQKAATLVGKRVRNEPVEKDGRRYVRLVID